MVGFALYWVIMIVSLHRVRPGIEVSNLLTIVANSRWPHVVVPYKFRIPLPILGLVLLLFMLVTGGLLMLSFGATALLWGKIACFLCVLALAHVMMRRPAQWAMALQFGLVLLIIVLSALLIRG